MLSAPSPAQAWGACLGRSREQTLRPEPPLHGQGGLHTRRLQGAGWSGAAALTAGPRLARHMRRCAACPTFRLGGGALLHLKVLPSELELGALLVAVLARKQLCEGGRWLNRSRCLCACVCGDGWGLAKCTGRWQLSRTKGRRAPRPAPGQASGGHSGSRQAGCKDEALALLPASAGSGLNQRGFHCSPRFSRS